MVLIFISPSDVFDGLKLHFGQCAEVFLYVILMPLTHQSPFKCNPVHLSIMLHTHAYLISFTHIVWSMVSVFLYNIFFLLCFLNLVSLWLLLCFFTHFWPRLSQWLLNGKSSFGMFLKREWLCGLTVKRYLLDILFQHQRYFML